MPPVSAEGEHLWLRCAPYSLCTVSTGRQRAWKMGIAEVIHQTGKAVFCLIINFLDLLSIWIRCLKYHLLQYFFSVQMMQGKGFSGMTLIVNVLNVRVSLFLGSWHGSLPCLFFGPARNFSECMVSFHSYLHKHSFQSALLTPVCAR